MIGAISRGLTLDIFCKMNPGQIIDYCIEYNNTMIIEDNNESAEYREANQNDFDKF